MHQWESREVLLTTEGKMREAIQDGLKVEKMG